MKTQNCNLQLGKWFVEGIFKASAFISSFSKQCQTFFNIFFDNGLEDVGCHLSAPGNFSFMHGVSVWFCFLSVPVPCVRLVCFLLFVTCHLLVHFLFVFVDLNKAQSETGFCLAKSCLPGTTPAVPARQLLSQA